MYTRCPSCSSTFRVTAALLQMADGEVRCGSCGAVFNALHTLIDDWSGADFTLPGAPRLIHPDEPLPAQQPPPAGAAAPAVPETLEFNVPENEWQRFFIAAEEDALSLPDPGLGADFGPAADPESSPADDAALAGAEAPPPDETMDQPGLPRSLEEETADTDTWQAFLREAEAEPDEEADDEPLFVIGEAAARTGEVGILIRRPTGIESGAGLDAESVARDSGKTGADPGLAGAAGPDPDEPDAAAWEADGGGDAAAMSDVDKPEPVPPETVLDWGGPPPFAERAPRPPAHTGRWFAASSVAALLLGIQVLHHYRDTLAADPDYGQAVRELYGRLGWPLYPAWPLDAYEMRDSKAIAEKSAPGTLDIVAEIAVTGRQPVGLPLVRVILRDRWSSPVASGVFDPGQYLADPQVRSPAYPPGTLIPVEISLQDPGSSAQGFELDVCVPNRTLGLQCKMVRDPFRR